MLLNFSPGKSLLCKVTCSHLGPKSPRATWTVSDLSDATKLRYGQFFMAMLRGEYDYIFKRHGPSHHQSP